MRSGTSMWPPDDEFPEDQTCDQTEGLRCASAERHSDPLRSQLNTMGRVRRVFRVCVCRNVLATTDTRQEVRICESNLPTHERSKNEVASIDVALCTPSLGSLANNLALLALEMGCKTLEKQLQLVVAQALLWAGGAAPAKRFRPKPRLGSSR